MKGNQEVSLSWNLRWLRGFSILIWTWGDWELYSAQSEILEFLCNRQKFILDLNDRELDLLNRFIFFEDLCLGDLSLSFLFFFWNFVYGDLSFEDFFRRFFLLKICLGGFSFYEDVFMEICHLKICLREFSFWRYI